MKKRIIYKKHYKTWHFHSVYCLCALKEKNKQTNKHTFWNSGLFLSADLPETESSRDELVCLRRRGGRLHSRAPHVDVWIWKARAARGRYRIRYNELRQENWTSRRFHTDYFNIEYLFWTWLTSFKSRHFKLSIHIFLMYLRRVFAEIQVVLFTCLWRKVTETEPAENAPCLFY